MNTPTRLRIWADDLDDKTRSQAEATAALPIIAGHVALMPDAHLGYGAAIGSVVPTQGAIIPSAVGVDIGCGMAAIRTDLDAGDLPDTLDPILDTLERTVPAGVGEAHSRTRARADAWLAEHQPRTVLEGREAERARLQLGTLGSGNHFVEISLDEHDQVWVVLHSGSRGPGNRLAQGHIRTAKTIERHIDGVEVDPDLRWFTEGTPEFDHYVADLNWAQAYAYMNREIMLDAAHAALVDHVGRGDQLERVSCHHNYAEIEHHHGRDIWVTRKGAIRARAGDLGIIPGSMGTDSYIVEGLGNPDSYTSASHGAGRVMSRNQARKILTLESFDQAMGERTWLRPKASKLLDEHPAAYKDIRHVMDLQADLVKVRHRLQSVLNYKGSK